jgi:poly-gamma-glutamate synthesis protein (capsule biosynthesis protein)
VTILVGGDDLTGERIGPQIKANRYENVLDAATAERFRNADFSLINLETSVSTRGKAAQKAFTFRSPPENLAFLRDYMGVDVASLANNHALDFGQDAFDDTLKNAREYGITPIGGGENLAKAAEPYLFDNGETKIAVFATNQIVPAMSWQATADGPGQLISTDPSNLGILAENIAAAKQTNDIVMVYLHWGIEKDRRPSAQQINTAHALVALGVDVVIGSHPHVIQSTEYYKGKPIIYSMGNFIFNNLNPQTTVAEITVDKAKDTVAVRYVPLEMKGTLTFAPTPQRSTTLLGNWNQLAINATIDDTGLVAPTPEGTAAG